MLTDGEVLALFQNGRYRLDEKDQVVNRFGRTIRSLLIPGTTAKPEHAYYFVRVYGNGGYRTTALHRVVWMVRTNTVIPDGWEVHHRDEDRNNNGFRNLICLHRLDHQKMHEDYEDDTIPF